MSLRSIKWQYYSRRQLRIALGLGCGIAAVASTRETWTISADSGSSTTSENSAWSKPPTVVATDATVSLKPQRRNKTDTVQKAFDKQTVRPPTRGFSNFDAEGDYPNGGVSALQDASNRLSAACDCFSTLNLATLRSITQT